MTNQPQQEALIEQEAFIDHGPGSNDVLITSGPMRITPALNTNYFRCQTYGTVLLLFFARVFIFSSCFLFCSITDNTKLHFYGLSMLSSIKCTSKNTKYTQIFRTVWRYLY